MTSTGSRFVPEERKTLYGQEFGAGFGYSLAKVNANGDNHLDLLVGAPFRDGGKTGRGGAVYSTKISLQFTSFFHTEIDLMP